jgi:hypothetical protein
VSPYGLVIISNAKRVQVRTAMVVPNTIAVPTGIHVLVCVLMLVRVLLCMATRSALAYELPTYRLLNPFTSALITVSVPTARVSNPLVLGCLSSPVLCRQR